MLIFGLRREDRLTGEAASFRLLEEVLRELGQPCDRAPDAPSVARLAQLSHIAGANTTDTLIVKMPTAAQLPFAFWATRKFRGRVIHWIDGLLWRPLSAGQMWRLFTGEPLLTAARVFVNNHAWLRLVHDREMELVVASKTQRDELAPLLPNAKIRVIPNGSAAGKVASPFLSKSLRSAAGMPQLLSLGYLGHTYITKGVSDLLAAHELLQRRGASVRFVFALSGLGSDSIAHAATRAGIELRGEVDPAEFFGSIDALVVPLWAGWGTQTFPNVLLEALEHGVPVIASDLPICREIFGDGLAIYVPPHDPAALARTIAAITSGDIALPSPERIRKRFAAHFSKEHIARGWRTVLSHP